MSGDATSTSRRLPRGPQPPKPQDGEKIRKRSGADLQNGWLGRHGTLYLSDERLVFVPTILDTILLGRRHEIRLDRLAEVERYPRDVEDLPGGGRRSRLYLHAPECTYELMVPDLDAWIDAIEVVYRLRAKRGETYMPVITRTGVENLLLTDE
ncbi:MAG: hypothetical protein R2878_08880 [Thermoleophilia bacterium]